MGVQTLLAGGYDQIYSKCFQISVVVTIISNVILIGLFDIVGAAMAPLLSESVLFILLASEVKKIFN